MPDAEVALQKSVASKPSSRFLKLLYNQNPFYLISAGVILYGIRTSFVDGQVELDHWLLTGLFAGYISLLAITSFLIVRFGRVWDDARSIFMVLLLFFFALSVSFDSLIVESAETAAMVLGVGFLFCLVVTEGILLSLKIRFPIPIRIPFYLMLAASFFYPLLFALKHRSFAWWDERWLLVGFSLVAGLAILTLVPAIKKGRKLFDDNGTPWAWPMFPYSVFVLMVVGLCGRTALLCMSFDASTGAGTIFGAYLLIPIALACCVVLIELGIVETKATLSLLGLWLIPLTSLLALPWSEVPAKVSFLGEMTTLVGAPVWLTAVSIAALMAFYFYRKVDGAEFLFKWSLIACLFLETNGEMVAHPLAGAVWPGLVLAAFWLRSHKERAQSVAWWWAAVALCPAVFRLAETVGTAGHGYAITVHWLLFLAVIFGFAFWDRFALQLRVLSAFAVAAISIFAVAYYFSDRQASDFFFVYQVCLVLFSLCVYQYARDKLYLLSAWVACSVSLVAVLHAWGTTAKNEFTMGNLEGFFAAGLICFAIGVFVSCLKAGLGARLGKSLARFQFEFRQRFEVFG